MHSGLQRRLIASCSSVFASNLLPCHTVKVAVVSSIGGKLTIHPFHHIQVVLLAGRCVLFIQFADGLLELGDFHLSLLPLFCIPFLLCPSCNIFCLAANTFVCLLQKTQETGLLFVLPFGNGIQKRGSVHCWAVVLIFYQIILGNIWYYYYHFL